MFVYIFLVCLHLSCLFTEDESSKELCKVKLNEKDLTTFRDAIEDLYYFEFVLGKYTSKGHTISCNWHLISKEIICFKRGEGGGAFSTFVDCSN